MARHRTWNTVAGLGYFWAITQQRDHYHPITANDDNVVWLTGQHFIANIEPTELRPDHRSVAACVVTSQPGICLTRSSVAVAVMWPDNTTTNIHKQVPSVLWRCWLGGRKGIRPVKIWVVGCWHGYLSGARCRLAYGPADATATHCLLLQLNPHWFYLSGTGPPG